MDTLTIRNVLNAFDFRQESPTIKSVHQEGVPVAAGPEKLHFSSRTPCEINHERYNRPHHGKQPPFPSNRGEFPFSIPRLHCIALNQQNHCMWFHQLPVLDKSCCRSIITRFLLMSGRSCVDNPNARSTTKPSQRRRWSFEVQVRRPRKHLKVSGANP